MAFKIIAGNTYIVDAANSSEAWALFDKYINETATAEEQAKVTDQGYTSFEITGEQDGPVNSDEV